MERMREEGGSHMNMKPLRQTKNNNGNRNPTYFLGWDGKPEWRREEAKSIGSHTASAGSVAGADADAGAGDDADAGADAGDNNKEWWEWERWE